MTDKLVVCFDPSALPSPKRAPSPLLSCNPPVRQATLLWMILHCIPVGAEANEASKDSDQKDVLVRGSLVARRCLSIATQHNLDLA